MRKLTREDWLWYVGFPLGILGGLLVFGALIASGPIFFTTLVPVALAVSIALLPAVWWINHFGKPVSTRATDLSVIALFASVLIDATRFVLGIDRGIVYSILEAGSLAGFLPGLLCGLYYAGMGNENEKMDTGQKMILVGFFSIAYLGFGVPSVRNISSQLFNVDLLPSEIWLWLGRVAFQISPVLMAVGILITRRHAHPTRQEPEESYKSWGEALQGLTVALTILGLALAGLPVSVLAGFIAIIVGLLFYPIGRIVTLLTKPKSNA